MKMIKIMLAIIILALVGIYLYATLSLKPLDEKARANASGEFVELPSGTIHYKWSGPIDSPMVVMIHGFSTPSFVFNQNAEGLTNSGYRVLQFDHFGRGWSDRPRVDYSADFYDQELLDLLKSLQINKKVNLVGYSMGGAIAAEFAARHPGLVNKVILLASAGLSEAVGDDLSVKLVKLPVLGDWIMSVFGKSILTGDPQYQIKDPQTGRRLQGDVKEQMEYIGYLPALLSTLRNLSMSDLSNTFIRLAETDLPVLAIFGKDDPTIPIESEERIRALVPQAKTLMIEGADHGLPYKRFDVVNSQMISFLNAI